jgi:PKD repeat protein
MAIVSRSVYSGHGWWVGNGGLSASNADITLTMHSSNSNFDTATTATSTNSWAGGFLGSPVNDLFPAFFADVTSGPSPLTVNFTDTSVTNDPNGIISWAWDFENDGTDDAFIQNPSFTYANCGDFSVKLTVIDSINGPKTVTENNLITTDNFAASFSQGGTLVGNSSPVPFAYTGDPVNPTVSWDFDGDGLIDATGLNASFTFANPGIYTVTMNATLNCRTNVVTSTIEVISGDIIVAQPGPAGTLTGFVSPPDASYLDLTVNNPQGILITDLLFRTTTVGSPIDLEVYVNLGNSVVGNIAASNFTLAGNGTGTATVADELFTIDITDFILPPGTHGLAVVTRTPSSSHRWYIGNAGITSSDANVTLTPQSSSTNFDTSTTATSTNSFAGGFLYSVGANFPPGTILQFAPGCAGAQGVPDIQFGVTPPTAGQTAALRVVGVNAGVQLHGGISNQFNATFGVPLPVNLGPILGTQPSCRFFSSSEVIILAFPDAFGDAVVALPIPGTPLFQGLTVYTQGLVFDATVPAGVITTNAYLAVII